MFDDRPLQHHRAGTGRSSSRLGGSRRATSAAARVRLLARKAAFALSSLCLMCLSSSWTTSSTAFHMDNKRYCIATARHKRSRNEKNGNSIEIPFHQGRGAAMTLGQTVWPPLSLPLLQQTSSQGSSYPYGRGAEIWPPPDDDDRLVKLSDSFPNGIIPNEARNALKRIGEDPELSPPSEEEEEEGTAAPASTARKQAREWRRKPIRAIARRILRRAAAKEEEDAFLVDPESSSSESSSSRRLGGSSPAKMDKTPAVLAMTLFVLGYTRPLDWLLLAFLSGYFVVLSVAARDIREDGVTPVLPALPPNGHVPVLISNPLGYGFSYSLIYHRWLKLGVVLGLLLPLLVASHAVLIAQDPAESASLVLRPLFLLCCQAVTESACRRAVTPLPIRILVPVAYNTVRMGYLWNWTITSITTTAALAATKTASAGAIAAARTSHWLVRILGIANLLYWGVNLFGFLIPVATMRYIRSHVIGVELEQATMRSGMEESIGMVP